ncbi:hypothetical protein ACIQFU_31590 [Streptomyces sp. NPDC093065]|uniref:hypothetical protein n=1 Tax=Streptomyces sp. NPDC093065 TaxID=3366021 RepID=UPI0038064302
MAWTGYADAVKAFDASHPGSKVTYQAVQPGAKDGCQKMLNAVSRVAVPPPLVVIGSLVSVLPLLLAFLAHQRFWCGGTTAGAVK